MKKRADLNAQLDNLLKVYKEKHPAVVAKQSEIQRVNEEFENLKKSSEKRVAVATQSSTPKGRASEKEPRARKRTDTVADRTDRTAAGSKRH